MEPILEQQRRYHEERERLMDAMVGESLHSGIIPGASSAASGKSAFSDVTLRVGDRSSFPCSKFILAARSEVFR